MVCPPISIETSSINTCPMFSTQLKFPPVGSTDGSSTWRYTLWIRSPFLETVHDTLRFNTLFYNKE